MKKLVALSFVLIAFAQDSAAYQVLAVFKCVDANLTLDIEVDTEGLVAWTVTDSKGTTQSFMGYLYGDNANDFSSTDQGSDVEVRNGTAELRLDNGVTDSQSTLTCQQTH